MPATACPDRHALLRLTLALAVVWTFVVQAIVGGALAGQKAALMSVDREIHLTLCAPGAGSTPVAPESAGHAPDCCQQVCAAVALLIPPSAGSSSIDYPRAHEARPGWTLRSDAARAPPWRLDSSPRAPPRIA